MILKFDDFFAINESFKSKIITDLYKSGYLDGFSKELKGKLNQLEDDEVIGVANSEDEAKKMLHDTLGDMNVTRYKQKRVWYRCGEDDYDDDWVDDKDAPYTVNRTVDEYKDWVFELKNNKYLVVRVESRELNHRFWEVINNKKKYRVKDNPQVSETTQKLQKRKRFLEKYDDDIKHFKKVMNFFKEKNLLDEFLEKANDEIAKYFNKHYVDGESNSAELDFEVGDYAIYLVVDFTGCYDDGFDVENMEFSVIDENGNEIIVFNYLPGFDKNIVINF